MTNVAPEREQLETRLLTPNQRAALERLRERAPLAPAPDATLILNALHPSALQYHLGVAAWQIDYFIAAHDALAAPYLDEDTSWLDYPPTNVRVAMHIMADLLETHGDWETVLTIYFRGRQGKSFASRRWVNRVFKEVDRTVRPVQRRLERAPGSLDDFGPRHSSELQTDWLRQSPRLQRTDNCAR